METLITLKNIRKIYDENLVVLKGINLTIKSGSFISVVGPSGSGKSTLLNIIGALDECTSGEYLIKNKIIKYKHAAKIRNEYMGFVFQIFSLIPNLSVRDNLLIPVQYSRKKIDYKNRIDELLNLFGLKALENKKIDFLSGGEKQRIAIARAMMLKPKIILADEPTGALDEANADIVIGAFRQYVEEGNSVIMVTHDGELAAKTDRKLRIKEGIIYEVN